MAALVGDLSRTGKNLFSAASVEVLGDFDVSMVLTSSEKTDTMDVIISRYNGYTALAASQASMTSGVTTAMGKINDLLAEVQTIIDVPTAHDPATVLMAKRMKIKYNAALTAINAAIA